MKNHLVLALLLILSSSVHAAVQTVSHVDVSRYLGTWYQIARNPLFFEGNCVCSRQVLTPNPDGRVAIWNTCNDPSPTSAVKEIRGFATNTDPATNSKFSVDFGLPVQGEYWIVGLDSEYRWAVVSDSAKFSLYILSKTPTLSSALYQAALQQAAKQLPIGKLTRTSQAGCTYP